MLILLMVAVVGGLAQAADFQKQPAEVLGRFHLVGFQLIRKLKQLVQVTGVAQNLRHQLRLRDTQGLQMLARRKSAHILRGLLKRNQLLGLLPGNGKAHGIVGPALFYQHVVNAQVGVLAHLAHGNIQRKSQAAERAARAEAEAQRQRFHAVLQALPAQVAVYHGPGHVYAFVNPRYQAHRQGKFTRTAVSKTAVAVAEVGSTGSSVHTSLHARP